jgi:hypothetical protein
MIKILLFWLVCSLVGAFCWWMVKAVDEVKEIDREEIEKRRENDDSW